MNKPVREKSQIIDDDSEFRIEQLETLTKETHRLNQKQYQIVSIIGSQSSGKSTLLNSLFGTDFEVLNRRQRVGQTTKGIWFSVETPSNIIILDVEGSDSNEREERTKVERKNSLFAFAISHTLLINIWIQQIGTFKGAQLEILEIILELNLKLFGAEKPKQIVFVVRDFVERKENPPALKEKLISKVQDAWDKIPKPADKSHVKLTDVFELNVFFLPSKLQEREKENWAKGIGTLKDFLAASTKNKELVNDNIPVTDLPQFMENIWQTIEKDKDIDLPQEKILLSSMRCQEIKKKAYETHSQQFRDEIQRSQRSINTDFASNIRNIVDKMMSDYDAETGGYLKEEVDRVRDQLDKELTDRIQESFHKQANLIADDCLRQFLDAANKIFAKDKSLEQIKELKPKTLASFDSYIDRVAYIAEWGEVRKGKFQVELDKKFDSQKEKIVNDSMKDFDRILKKQMENVVSNAFYDRKIFTEGFWETLRKELHKVGFKSKNSIQGLYNKLEMGGKKEARDKKLAVLTEQAERYALQELKSFVRMKCIDLRYFLMKHFNNEFSNDQEVPRQWQEMQEEDIKKLYEEKKGKYMELIFEFSNLQLEEEKKGKADQIRISMIDPRQQDEDNELLTVKEEKELRKRLEEEMQKELEDALRKNKETYSGSIPTWALVVLGVAALDDVMLWLSSPMIAFPLTVVLIAVVLAFFFGGKSLADKLFGAVRNATEGAVANATRSAATSILKKSRESSRAD